MTSSNRSSHEGGTALETFLIVVVEREHFAIAVSAIQTIFNIPSITPVPLSPPEIRGLVNLRGRVVTAVSLRRHLGLPDQTSSESILAIGIEHAGESFALIVDEVGDVLTAGPHTEIPVPPHFEPHRADLIKRLFKFDERLVPELSIATLLQFAPSSEIAGAHA